MYDASLQSLESGVTQSAPQPAAELMQQADAVENRLGEVYEAAGVSKPTLPDDTHTTNQPQQVMAQTEKLVTMLQELPPSVKDSIGYDGVFNAFLSATMNGGNTQLAQTALDQARAGATDALKEPHLDAEAKAALQGLLAEIDSRRGVGDNVNKVTDDLNKDKAKKRSVNYSLVNVKHAVGSAKQAQSVLDGINPKYFNSDSRFGGGFYVGGDSVTIVAELAEHGNTAKYAISYDLNMNGQKVLDLTNSKIAAAWDFTPRLTSTNACQDIAEVAKAQGYNVIKFESYRGGGANYVVFNNFEEVLIPRIVTPID